VTTTDTTAAPSTRRADATRVLTKVPEIAALFWVLKLLTTGMGEAMSDALRQKSVPIAAAVETAKQCGPGMSGGPR
jgi:uncharacterized membrane-anchored protein